MDQRLEGFWERLSDALASVPLDASQPPRGARVGAVLALFEETDEGPGLVLTRRRRDLRSHPGQVSFPGGRVDQGETVEQAALREAWEEIGLRPESVAVVGAGPTFYIPPSRFWVVPVVARWESQHELTLNPWEVDEVLHVAIATLLERDRWRHVPSPDRGSMWAWQLDDDLLWGATAMMITTLLDVVLEGWTQGMRPYDLGPELAERPWETFPLTKAPARLEGIPEVSVERLPTLTAEQARAVSRLLAEEAHVELAQVLEHAGRAVTGAVRRLVGGDLTGVKVTVLAGPGGNGAGGLASARLLASAGAEVTVLSVGRAALPEQVEGLRAAGVHVADFTTEQQPGDVVVDALLGVGVDPPVRGGVADVMAWLRVHDTPVVSLDLPSGMHPDRGVAGPCVSAEVTIALGAPTAALVSRMGRSYVGDRYVADLGIPPEVWRKAGVEPLEVFGRGPLVRLVDPEDADEASDDASGGEPDDARGGMEQVAGGREGEGGA